MSIDYREIHQIQQRLRQIRVYLREINPRIAKSRELKLEQKQLLKRLGELAV